MVGTNSTAPGLFDRLDDARRCLKCQEAKPRSEFTGRQGLGQCKACKRKANATRQKRWQAKRPAALKRANAAWRARNPDKVREHNRAWRKKNPDKVRALTQRWRRDNPEVATASQRASTLKLKYKMGLADYQVLHAAQHGLCAICGQPETVVKRHGKVASLAVDHCHLSNRIRGLLCSRCNLLIGYAKDDPAILRAAIAYLARHSAA